MWPIRLCKICPLASSDLTIHLWSSTFNCARQWPLRLLLSSHSNLRVFLCAFPYAWKLFPQTSAWLVSPAGFCSNVALSVRPALTTLSKGVASLVSVTWYLLSTYYTFVHLKTSRLDINVLFFQLSSSTSRAVTDRKTTHTKRKSYKHILKAQEVLQYRNASFTITHETLLYSS